MWEQRVLQLFTSRSLGLDQGFFKFQGPDSGP